MPVRNSGYSAAEISSMQKEAEERVREMQRKARRRLEQSNPYPPPHSPVPEPHPPVSQNAPFSPPKTPPETQKSPRPEPDRSPLQGILDRLDLDGETVLLLLLLLLLIQPDLKIHSDAQRNTYDQKIHQITAKKALLCRKIFHKFRVSVRENADPRIKYQLQSCHPKSKPPFQHKYCINSCKEHKSGDSSVISSHLKIQIGKKSEKHTDDRDQLALPGTLSRSGIP